MSADLPTPAAHDACLAATLLAIDPDGLHGACIRARPGPARDAWSAFFRAALPAEQSVRRLPIAIEEDRLLGGLDLVQTLKLHRPVYRPGFLAENSGGIVQIPMAERIPARLGAHLRAVIDSGEVVVERDGATQRAPVQLGLILLDESIAEDENVSPELLDRLAFLLDLTQTTALVESPDARAVLQARALLPRVRVGDEACESLCAVALQLGIASLRASLLAVRAARALAALGGRTLASAQDVETAGRLVLAPRATQLPAQEEAGADEGSEDPPQSPDKSDAEDESVDAPKPADSQEMPEDLILAAVVAAIPPKLLQHLRSSTMRHTRSDTRGRSGALRKSGVRGRPAGTRSGKPGGNARLNLVETLRAAAPWQTIRRAAAASDDRRLLQIRSSDLRVTRCRQRTQTTTIFVVDASGSAALTRLAEAKGAVELLLADCYVRRDQVSVIAFRGKTAELLLPPTRSLLRAKRNLAGLPGGGGTPLAAGIRAATLLAENVRRGGQTPTVVLLTDGRANIALDGSPGRERAGADAQAAARYLQSTAIASLLIDISSHAQDSAQALARGMAARYLWLPYADAAGLSKAVKIAAATTTRA